MRVYEKELLSNINEKITFCLYRNMDKDYIIDTLNNFIYSLPQQTSIDFLLKLCEIRNNIKDRF